MTLCIAAESRRKVILGSDFRGEFGDYTSAENQNKLEWVENVWPILIAGTVARAHDLVAAINWEFSSVRAKGEKIDDTNVAALLRAATRRMKYQVADVITGGELGISYGAFLKNGKAYLSEKAFDDIESNIRSTDLSCEAIFTFFHDQRPYIYEIDGKGGVGLVDNFCCIGSGSWLANASLHFREHEYDQTLRTSVYQVFEAHQLATRAPGVGEKFAISVFHQERNGTIVWERLEEAGARSLARSFTLLGPKKIRGLKLDIKKHLKEFNVDTPPGRDE